MRSERDRTVLDTVPLSQAVETFNNTTGEIPLGWYVQFHRTSFQVVHLCVATNWVVCARTSAARSYAIPDRPRLVGILYPLDLLNVKCMVPQRMFPSTAAGIWCCRRATQSVVPSSVLERSMSRS